MRHSYNYYANVANAMQLKWNLHVFTDMVFVPMVVSPDHLILHIQPTRHVDFD